MSHVASTGRLRLRLVQAADAPLYLALLTDPDFIRFVGDRGVRTLEAAVDSIEAGPIAMQRSRGHSMYVVELAGSGEPLGMSGLIKRDVLDDVDIGYAFLPQHRGRGYALEAAQAVVAHACSLGIARLAAIVDPVNLRSIALLLRLGMRFERHTQLTPGQSGVNLYGMVLAPAART